MSWSLPLLFFFRSFMVLGLTFQSLIHFELIHSDLPAPWGAGLCFICYSQPFSFWCFFPQGLRTHASFCHIKNVANTNTPYPLQLPIFLYLILAKCAAQKKRLDTQHSLLSSWSLTHCIQISPSVLTLQFFIPQKLLKFHSFLGGWESLFVYPLCSWPCLVTWSYRSSQ